MRRTHPQQRKTKGKMISQEQYLKKKKTKEKAKEFKRSRISNT
jgi:hypothetical protein